MELFCDWISHPVICSASVPPAMTDRHVLQLNSLAVSTKPIITSRTYSTAVILYIFYHSNSPFGFILCFVFKMVVRMEVVSLSHLSLCSTPSRSLLCLDQMMEGRGFPFASHFNVKLDPSK